MRDPDSPTVLLTLGRLPKALELSRALHGAGARVIIADPFNHHLCKPSRAVDRSIGVPPPAAGACAYVDALLDIIRDQAVSLVIPVSEEAPYTTLLDKHLPDGVQLFGPDHATLMALHDKERFIAHANAAGLNAPMTYRANSPGAADLSTSTDYVVKPIHGCSGQGLRLRLRGMALSASDMSPDNIVQTRIHGQEISSQTIAHQGRVIGTSLYRGLVFAGSVACCFEQLENVAIEKWIRQFVAAHQYSGFIAFDFIIDEHATPWPIECNPRLTSGIHFMNDADIAKAVLNPNAAMTIRKKPERRFQEGHTTLTKVYASIGRPREAMRRFWAMARARDVLWSIRDPLPFLLMTPMSWPILRQTMTKGLTFGQAATADLKWVSRSNESQPSGERNRAVVSHEEPLHEAVH